MGREGGKAKAYIYSFYDVILLFKSFQEGRGCLKITKFERPYFMDEPFLSWTLCSLTRVARSVIQS